MEEMAKKSSTRESTVVEQRSLPVELRDSLTEPDVMSLFKALLKGCDDPLLAMAALQEIREVGAGKAVAVLGPKIEALTKTVEALTKTVEALTKTVEAQTKTIEALSKTVEAQGRELRESIHRLEKMVEEQRVRTEEMDKRLDFSNKVGIAALTVGGVLLAAVIALVGQMLPDRSAIAPFVPQQPAVQSIPTEDADPGPGRGPADQSAVGEQASDPATDPG